jgi:hypothetical protein
MAHVEAQKDGKSIKETIDKIPQYRLRASSSPNSGKKHTEHEKSSFMKKERSDFD